MFQHCIEQLNKDRLQSQMAKEMFGKLLIEVQSPVYLVASYLLYREHACIMVLILRIGSKLYRWTV